MSESRAEALRRAFDSSFAARPSEPAPSVELLGIDLGDEHVCVRVSELSAVHAAERIRRVPGAPPVLLGVVGLRGRVVPVFDLAALMGRSPCAAPRWMLLAGAPSVGLAVAGVEKQQRVLATQIIVGARSDRFTHGVAELTGAPRAILSLSEIVEEIRRRATIGPSP